MSGLNTTLASLSRQAQAWTERVGQAASSAPSSLDTVTTFGANPGRLEMRVHVPTVLPPSPALVVVLHGCTQNAGYAQGAGWTELADAHGFVVLCPQQTSANNPKTCFNWFDPRHTARGEGEAASIRAMIEHAVVTHGVDRARIFVTGLSAGGAMTAAMLATYPEVFAGGAIVAGLPYGTARNVQGALESMFQGRAHPASEWGDLVRAASPHRGPWPKLSVWHGDADSTVKAMNAAEIVKQWRDVHGLPDAPSERGTLDGQTRTVWRNTAGEAVIEQVTITGMGHGTPLAVGQEGGGTAGPFLLDVGIASTRHIAAFWGLLDARDAVAATPARVTERHSDTSLPLTLPSPHRGEGSPRPTPDTGTSSHPTLDFLDKTGLDDRVMGVIRKAFDSAGLTR